MRETDVVARLGGDEFTVLLESLTDGQGVATLTQKIINALEQPLNLADQTLFISASIGISIFPGDGHNAALQRLAHGVSKWRIFSELSTAPGLTLGTSGWGGSLTALASPRFWARIARDIHPLGRQSFVHDIPHDLDDMAIARAVIALATRLKLKVVGEGVKTEAQRAFLEAKGCHEVQGFFYCKLLPAEEVVAYIRQHTLQTQATA